MDDCSTDGTAEMVRKNYAAEQNIQVVRLKKNQGKGMAVRVGMLSARGARRLFVDADGATRFSDLDSLDAALEEGADCAFGSRHHLVQGAMATRAW